MTSDWASDLVEMGELRLREGEQSEKSQANKSGQIPIPSQVHAPL